MEQSFIQSIFTEKAERYKYFLTQFISLCKGKTHPISLLANTSAALHEAFGFFWVGFYLVKNDSLILGPFQGNVACFNIPKGRGVCGKAWAEKRTIIVSDVDKFPGHIACNSFSRSEIVVPLFSQNEVKGVLDIDSNQLNAFNDTDQKYLEQVTQLLSQSIFNSSILTL